MAARLRIEPARASIELKVKEDSAQKRKEQPAEALKRATPKNPDRGTHAGKTEGQEGLVGGLLSPGVACIAPWFETSESSLYLT